MGPNVLACIFKGGRRRRPRLSAGDGRDGTAHPLQGVRKRLPGMNIGMNARGFRWQELSTPLLERRGGKHANPLAKEKKIHTPHPVAQRTSGGVHHERTTFRRRSSSPTKPDRYRRWPYWERSQPSPPRGQGQGCWRLLATLLLALDSLSLQTHGKCHRECGNVFSVAGKRFWRTFSIVILRPIQRGPDQRAVLDPRTYSGLSSSRAEMMVTIAQTSQALEQDASQGGSPPLVSFHKIKTSLSTAH